MRLAAATLSLVSSVCVGLGACGGARLESPCTAGPAFAPFDLHLTPARRAPDADDDASAAEGGAARGVADGLVGWYQRLLRRPELPGAGCPFYPSCSVFARRALDRWGVFALVLIADRLFVREHPWAGASYPVHCDPDHQRGLWDDPVP
jgi:putative component of membrane protein insertase Oxa1/YidC/SpoIIIJ protein YidD